MARAPAKKSLAPIEATATRSKGSQALATIDQELAGEIANLKNEIGQASGNKIKTEASGDFIHPDGRNLGNDIQLIVVDFTTHHDFYSGPYNKDNPTPPVCYARGKDLTTLAPEADSPEIQNDKCSTCPMNQFGSGSNGKSKACKNSRMVAVLVVDPDNPDAHNAPDAMICTIALPPTSIKSFDGAIGNVVRTLGHPIKAIFTVTGKPVGTYALIDFIDPMPNPDYAIHAARRGENVIEMLHRKPDFAAYESKQPASRGRAAPRRAAPARR